MQLISVDLPKSKSISNRLMVMEFLSGNTLHRGSLNGGEDVVCLQKALTKINQHRGEEKVCEIDVCESGTALRFLTAILAKTSGKWLLKGSERLSQRPIVGLVEALKQLGASIEYKDQYGFAPLVIEGNSLRGGRVHIAAKESSQYVSALMLIAPYLQSALHISYSEEIASKPYIEMTYQLMKYFGIKIECVANGFLIERGNYVGSAIDVEADWSAASYWYGIAALRPNYRFHLKGLRNSSLQADQQMAVWGNAFGIETILENGEVYIQCEGSPQSDFCADCRNTPDLVPTLAFLGATLGMRVRLSGLQYLNLKESERLTNLCCEINKIARAEIIGNDELVIIPEAKYLTQDTVICTYNDHRMEMAGVFPTLVNSHIRIETHHCSSKSYPQFFEQLSALGIK